METVQFGNRSPATMYLQVLLNKAGASPPLVADGIFGNKTRDATVSFQGANAIMPANGVVGAPTWSRLGASTERTHAIQLFGQPNSATCWSAASTMMHGSNQSVGPGNRVTTSGGDLPSEIGLDTDFNNVEGFVRDNGWHLVNRQSAPQSSVLIGALTRSPLWIGFQLNHVEHAVVFSGVYSHRDQSEDGTVFIVHDPWPPGQGSIYGTPYVNREVVLRSVSAQPRAIIQYAAARA